MPPQKGYLNVRNLPPGDSRIHRVKGACGCTWETATTRWPAIVRGDKVYLDCPTCERAVRVSPTEITETRYCSDRKCPRPDARLSRWNVDPQGRCNACQVRQREEWLEQLRNPFHSARDTIRMHLETHGEMTAVAIERGTGVPTSAIYDHLIALVKSGQVIRRRPRRALALYSAAPASETVAA